MQHLKNFNWKKFLLQGVLPCLLAVAVGFISRYQLELSDGVTESFLQLQWPLYAPLNALTAFCLTLILFALLGKWSRATGISGAVFTIIALINYYTRDLHGSALMPQDILNLGTAAEVMGSYTLKITQDVVKFRNQGEQLTVGLCPAEYVGEFPERRKNRLDPSEPGVGGEYARFLRGGGTLFLLQTEHQPDCLYIVPEMRLFIISHSLPTRLQPCRSVRHTADRTLG